MFILCHSPVQWPVVSYVPREAAGMPLPANAMSLALAGRDLAAVQLRSGDLVLFNTLGRLYSHVGIYLGNDEIIYAPGAGGQALQPLLGAALRDGQDAAGLGAA
jgi:cell wall-associated NlpC family hydrolase